MCVRFVSWYRCDMTAGVQYSVLLSVSRMIADDVTVSLNWTLWWTSLATMTRRESEWCSSAALVRLGSRRTESRAVERWFTCRLHI